MNKREKDVLNVIAKSKFENQRMLAEECGHSLGIVNQSIKNLINAGYLSAEMQITKKAKEMIQENSPRNAIILAAGFGMRMVPINRELPKALLKVKGEILIERTIRQLHEAGITKICVVVGFMKEHFEYLIDKYGVKLVVNPEYALKNNLHSLKYVLKELSNTYIVPCDLWCADNPYSDMELYSWYMVKDAFDDESTVRVGRNGDLLPVSKSKQGNTMVGISYFTEEKSRILKSNIEHMCKDKCFDKVFWEEALYITQPIEIAAKVVSPKVVVEINTYEQLRDFDSDSSLLKNDAISQIEAVFGVPSSEIKDITVLKKGMTNRSFLFNCKGEKYIMRIPGEGTERLINRTEEADVYEVVNENNICDDVKYMNPKTGYKITKFIEGARVCDPYDVTDIKKCMKVLRDFHDLKLRVKHEFDIFGQIEFYESLWDKKESVYQDYRQTKDKVMALREYIMQQPKKNVLTHIDAVPDNFLFYIDAHGKENIRLIDWEYAGMQDPHVDIAMFCIYSMYDKEHVDQLIDIYFEGQCPRQLRAKIYCYIAACGLLWSNWCEYKSQLGVEFGGYSLCQYRFAKEYYKYAVEEIGKIES